MKKIVANGLEFDIETTHDPFHGDRMYLVDAGRSGLKVRLFSNDEKGIDSALCSLVDLISIQNNIGGLT